MFAVSAFLVHMGAKAMRTAFVSATHPVVLYFRVKLHAPNLWG
jgi:hypothetical protein